MNSAKDITENTKKSLAKTWKIVSTKETRSKFRTWSEKSKLMRMELWLKYNLKIENKTKYEYFTNPGDFCTASKSTAMAFPQEFNLSVISLHSISLSTIWTLLRNLAIWDFTSSDSLSMGIFVLLNHTNCLKIIISLNFPEDFRIFSNFTEFFR